MKRLIWLVIVILIVVGLFIRHQIIKNSNTAPNPSGTTQTSSPTGTTLNLSNQGLTSVTASVYNQTNLTELIMSNNSIKTLPSQMGKLSQLATLKIDHNLLEGNLIGEIRQMSQLTTLDVSYNNMTGMPAEIGQLSHLQTLNYSHNSITGLPNELANLKNTLKTFDLTGNPLSQDTINQLKASLPNTVISF